MMIHRIIGVVGLFENGQVVQTVNFKSKNLVHANPWHAVKKFCSQGIDEILILDLSKNSINPNLVETIISKILKTCFIPVIYGGHVHDLSLVNNLFKLGIDRILVNTELYKKNNILNQIISKYGSQALLAGIDCDNFDLDSLCLNKNISDLSLKVKNQIDYLSSQKVTEIMFNSPKNDGKREGYSINSATINLIKYCEKKSISTVFMGGAWTQNDFLMAANLGVSGLAAANCFHYKEAFPLVIKKHFIHNNLKVVY